LAARLQKGALPWREALEVCGQIARGLAAAHEGGVIHRDLKPGNVMITPQGLVKVLDFGLARRGAATGDLPAGPSDPAVQGTWGYVSPECLTREEDHRADVFAFGCVLYECLAGVAAFPGSTVDEIRDALLRGEPDEARLPVDTPPAIRRLIASCVVKNPDRRLGSMAEAVRTIESALGRRAVQPVTRAHAGAATPHRLPEESDAFVGREDDLGELAGRLRRGARLVTLQGAGGMGKTRLAVRYGWRSLEEWAGGVWFCDLTEARSGDGIVAAVAGSLGVALGGGNPAAQLGHAIAGRGPSVLILDNFEQVAAHARTTLALWLERAPEARFVVTSRKRLDLPEEEVQAIGPLSGEPGEELFLERARIQRPGFEAGGAEGIAVREVVRLVEGIPLAIELAAARVRTMSSVQIVERMRERFRLLAGSGAGRHATLRAVLDGSWELLTPWEQVVLAQCAVFEGGFTLAAAEGVLDLTAWKDAPWIPDVIRSLVEQSLLRTWMPEPERATAATEPRFGMFVSVQEYAREKLEAGDGAALRAAETRHGGWYARYGSDAELAALAKPGGVERRRKLVRELANVEVACRRAASRGDGQVAADAYRAAWEVLQLRGPVGAAVALGREALAALAENPARRRVLGILGHTEWRAGHGQEGQLHLEEALALHREAGDRRAEGIVLGNLGGLLVERGRTEEARVRLEAALANAREVGDRRREGIEIARLSLLSGEQGRMEEALAQMDAVLAIAREVGDQNLESVTLGHLGVAQRELGQMEKAIDTLEAALEIAREVGNRRFEGITLHNLAVVAADQKRVEQASAYHAMALAIAREVGSRSFEGHALSAIGSLLLDQGRFEEARSALEVGCEILRELGERRFEGETLGELGRLSLEQGRFEEATTFLSRGEQLLRDTDARANLAILLCIRAELEHRAGSPEQARTTLSEVEAMALELHAEPGTRVGLQVEKTRQRLGAAE
jgi:predicted ATPase/tetratricopeptide (TPR) repeat protein